MNGNEQLGVAPEDLPNDDLRRELSSLHRMRHETFLHAGTSALDTHTARTLALESEYLRRHPQREIDLERTREGARNRSVTPG
jgi:hypothetical protein